LAVVVPAATQGKITEFLDQIALGWVSLTPNPTKQLGETNGPFQVERATFFYFVFDVN